MKCCLCGKEIKDYGHNPWPLNKNVDDRCCDECNSDKVIPARIANLTYSKVRKENNNGKC